MPIFNNYSSVTNLRVSDAASDFKTIEEALLAITDSSDTNPYIINVGAGIYLENELFLPPYVSIVGTSINTTIIKPAGNHNLFNMNNKTEVSFCTIEDVNTNHIAFNCYDCGNFVQFHKLSIYNCDTAFRFDSVTNDCLGYLEYVDINESFTDGVKIVSSNGFICDVNCENFYIFDSVSSDALHVSGETAALSVLAGVIQGSTGNGIYVDDGATLDVDTMRIEGFEKGICNPNIGAGSAIEIRSTKFENTLYDLEALNNDTVISFIGILDSEKLNIASTVNVTGLFTDTVNNRSVTVGSLYYGEDANTIFDFGTLLLEGSGLGVFHGGGLVDNGGLDLLVSNGFGYIEYDTVDLVKRVDWIDTIITLPANQSNYIYINNNAIVVYDSIVPDSDTAIMLGRVVTNDTSIEIINRTKINVEHFANSIDRMTRNGVSSLYANGSVTSESLTNPLKIDVSNGLYYYSTSEFIPSGGNEITFTSYYQGVSGFVKTITDTVDNANRHDTNTLSLVPLHSNYYTNHSLYLTGDGIDEKYFLVYGQEEFINQTAAEGASIPTPPNYFVEGVVLIASIIVQEGNSNIVSFVDRRPIMGTNTSVSVSGSLQHGNLLGLDLDHHLQYLLVNGSRSMGGNLDIGGNNISNATLINGIDILSHASRHVPNGADPLPTGVPVNIGTTNSAGINNSFSKSDHVHSHGTHSVGTNHAAVTITTNGFMSSTDKIKLDTISSNASVSSVGLSLPSIFSVTNSPVTSSGTLTGSLTTQLQNLIFAAPNGSTGIPTFRSLVENDIPTLSQSKITNLTTDLSNKQPIDATLTALSSFNSNGLIVQTALDTFTSRTITANSSKISILNGNGIAGNPSIDVVESNIIISNLNGDLPQSRITNLVTDLSNKQATLVSGTNIKTIEGQSLLGSGNIDLTKTDVGLANVDNVQQYPNTNPSGFETPAQLNTRDTNNRNRSNHTGTQLASTISDFQTTVSSNANVTANTAKLSALKTKSGVITPATFVGFPRKATVTFSTPFADANYSMTVIGTNGRTWVVETVTANGFTINSGSNIALTGNVYWTATKHGEN